MFTEFWYRQLLGRTNSKTRDGCLRGSEMDGIGTTSSKIAGSYYAGDVVYEIRLLCWFGQ